MKLNSQKASLPRKALTVVFLFVFSINSVFPAQAQPQAGSIKAPVLRAADFQKVALPESLAFTDKIYRGKKSEMIWILNDAHAVPAAQESISQTLQYLQKEAGLNFVGVEGATGYFETALLRAFPDSEKLEQTVRELWKKGEISGATLAALTDGNHARYFGAETAKLYEQGLKNYFSARQTALAYQAEFDSLRTQIDALKQDLFSEKLLKFDRLRSEMKKNSAQNLSLILDLASREMNDFEQSFPHLFVLAQELKEESAFSSGALSVWSREIGLKIESQAARKKWSAKEQAWQAGDLSDAQFAAFALAFCREQGWSPRIPEELQALARRGEALARMRSKIFVREWDALLTRLETVLAKSQAERDLTSLAHQAEILNDWLRLELSRETWKRTSQPFAAASDLKMKPLSADLENLRRSLTSSDLARFYENAEAREKALVENTLKQMRRDGQTAGVLVVGGFHTDGLASKLEKQNISYSILTPSVSELPAENRYDALMRGDVSWKKYLRVEHSQIQLYESFARALTHSLLNLDGERKIPGQAIANYKTWRENLIRGVHGPDAEKNLQALAFLDEMVLETVYPDEYVPIKQQWKKTFSKILPAVQRLKRSGELTPANLTPALSATAMFPLGNPLAPQAPVVAMPRAAASAVSRLPAAVPTILPGALAARSEARLRKEGGFVNVKDFPFLSNHAVYSRQFEAGLPRHLLERIENAAIAGEDQLVKEFGISKDLAAALVAQVNLTGGLGALMPDLFEAWEANAMPVTGIHPLWNWIKNRPEKALGRDGQRLPLGNMVKQYMEPTGIEYEVTLPITSRYRSYAQQSRARELLTANGHKQIFVRVYKTKSHFQNAPQYYLDPYYVEGGKEVPIFGEVYDDDNALRDFHMAVFSQASQVLIQKLEGKDDPEDIVLLDHEVFTSIPATRLKSAKLATLNHTVFRPGLYEPSENSYELLDFPQWMRGTIAHDGKVSIADYTAEAYDLLTGVGLVEHVPALHTNIFRWGWQKLRGFFDGKRRSTNGVYLPRWQSHPRRKLIEDYKKRLNVPAPKFGLPVEASDFDFFAELDKPENMVAKKEFMLKNEAVGASDAAELLSWLYQKHGIEWIKDSIGEFVPKNNVPALIADLTAMRADLNGMIEEGIRGDGRWEAFLNQRRSLIQALLRDPIGANVRRQVPYKGPDKYVEILNNILAQAKSQTGKNFDQGALFQRIKTKIEKSDFSDAEFLTLRETLKNSPVNREMREQMARVIIGGRTFDYGAHDRFLYIRFMANLLGLESRFATVENYNYHEARLIFKGAQGGIMLSDEILEASATSMEKAQTNMAEVIGVFGGAVPEIWVIRNVKTKEIKEVLDKDGDPAMTHDELREKLKSGEWEILNGILVEYQDGSKSEQVGGLRRPFADSLVNALKQLRASRSNPETRRQRMYDTLASSWRVDMVTSQAQAHAFLLENMLKAKAAQKALLGKTKAEDTDFEKITSAETFNWSIQRENLHPFYRGGVVGFVSAFRWLKSWQKPHANSSDRMASRGEDALAALRFHSERNDIFNYLIKSLAPLSASAQPVRERIMALQSRAKKESKERSRIALNLEAIELVDQFLVKTAGAWLEEYIAEETTAERKLALRELLEKSAFVDERKNEPQQPWAEYMARYLDHHPLVTALETSDNRVRSFAVAVKNRPMLVSLSVNAASSEEKDAADGIPVRKARATVYLNAKTAKILGEDHFESQELYRISEVARGVDYKLHTAVELQENLGIGIPMPLGVEVLAWKPAHAELAGVFQRAFQSKSFFDAVNTLAQRVQDATTPHASDDFSKASANGQAKAAFAKELEDLARLDPRSAEHLFTQDGRKAVMAFILMASPWLLDLTKQWHRDFYAKLNVLRNEHPEFFKSDLPVRVVTSSRNGTLVLAREDGNGNLLFVPLLFHVNQSEINLDGKVNTTLSGLEGLLVKPAYKITDGLTGQAYGTRADLLSSWVNRIPFSDRSQFLILEPAAQRSEARTADDSWFKDPKKFYLPIIDPIFASRREINDPGIGKFSDWSRNAVETLIARGAKVISILPQFDTQEESPYAPVDLYSLNRLFIDWSVVPEVANDSALLAKTAAPRSETNEINYSGVRRREAEIAARAFKAFEGIREGDYRRKDFENFKQKWDGVWLKDYAEFMATSDILKKLFLKTATTKESKYRESRLVEQWSDAEVAEAHRQSGFQDKVELYKYQQWIAYAQFAEALKAIHDAGGKVVFDVPMFRGKNSVDVWKNRKWFSQPEKLNPGVIFFNTDGTTSIEEVWNDLAVWNWDALEAEDFRPILRPYEHWFEFGEEYGLSTGLDGSRIDAFHFMYDFQQYGNLQLGRSGREPGDRLAKKIGELFRSYGKLGIAEAFEGKNKNAHEVGLVSVNGNWQTLGTHDSPLKETAVDFNEGLTWQVRLNEDYSDRFAKFIATPYGSLRGDPRRIKTMSNDRGTSVSHWNYRYPSENESGGKYRFDLTPYVQFITSIRSGEVDPARVNVWNYPNVIESTLTAAADSFVRRRAPGQPLEIWAASRDWFLEQWGRDTFIAMLGVLLETGRYTDAQEIFRSFAKSEKDGLIPNRIFPPDQKKEPEYNNVDGSLWFIQALEAYYRKTNDRRFTAEMMPVVERILKGYQGGVRYERLGVMKEIRMDSKDGLIKSPEQATWMDADPNGKGKPVTPRNGKAVEINALWYASLRFAAELTAGEAEADRLNALADRVKKSFNEKFINPVWRDKVDHHAAPLFDVIEGDAHAAALRPNMLLAISLGKDLLSPEMEQAVFDAAKDQLLTPYGLRTLSPRDSNYKGDYNTQSPIEVKDQAYHQGTVWPWLWGPFIDAYVKIEKRKGTSQNEIKKQIEAWLEPTVKYLLLESRVGSLPEVFSGGYPDWPEHKQTAGGPSSQAWSVGEVLRVLRQNGILNPARSELRAQSPEKPLAAERSFSAGAARVLAAAIIFTAGFLDAGQFAWAENVLRPVYAAQVLDAAHPGHFVPELIASSANEWMTSDQLGRSEARAWDRLDDFAAAHFAKNPKLPLHLGFTMPYDQTLDEMLVEYASKINALQKQYGSLVINDLTVLTAPGQATSPDFSERAAKLGVTLKPLTRGNEAAEILIYLKSKQHQYVFMYGLEQFGLPDSIPDELKPLIVRGAFSPQAIFNPAVMLNMATASSGRITADVVDQVVMGYKQFVARSKGSLTLLESILQGKLLELQVQQLIASMA